LPKTEANFNPYNWNRPEA